MKIKITGKGMNVSDYLRGVVQKKAEKLGRYFKPNTEMSVMLTIEKNRHIAEVTVPVDGILLRTEEATGDMYSSIDAVLKKLERKIRRHRTKLERRLHEDAFVSDAAIYDDDEFDEEEIVPRLVRSKKFSIKPMDIEEAMMQMELIGHSFFVFRNAETNDVNVLYLRNDGNYGLIEPDIG
jgi:putative sigma-54 modulation protein